MKSHCIIYSTIKDKQMEAYLVTVRKGFQLEFTINQFAIDVHFKGTCKK